MNTTRYVVLLIEDDTSAIDLARQAVAESSPEIDLIVVEGVDAVLDWLSGSVLKKAQIPDIILLDLKLPKLDGLAILRKLRKRTDTLEVPIVAFSAEYTQDDVLMGYQVGANSFVPKPADLEQFKEFFQEKLAYWMHAHQSEMVSVSGHDVAE